ncbi:hypothetical protein RJ641_027850, partial [Dillenia turbinata]
TRTVQVGHLSDLASEREIHEFFTFSGDIEHIEIYSEPGQSKTAYVTFKDPKALEIALLGWERKKGATIIDEIVSITPVENYVPKAEMQVMELSQNQRHLILELEEQSKREGRRWLANLSQSLTRTHKLRIVVNQERRGTTLTFKTRHQKCPEFIAIAKTSSSRNGRVYVTKAQDIVTNMLAKGSALGQDAMNKAKAFDEKHKLTAGASAKVISFDRRVGLSEKFTVGFSVVNEKVKSMDQRLQVSDKTTAALLAAERKLNDTGSAVKTSRYVTAGTAWLNGAFSRVAKAGQVAGTKTREKFHTAVSNLAAKEAPIAVSMEETVGSRSTPSND